MSPRRSALIVLTLLAALACNRKPSTPPDVILRVNERMVTIGDFKRYLERNTGTELAQMAPEVSSAMLDQYAEETILAEYAAAHGIEIAADKIAEAVRSDPGSTVIEKRDSMRRQKLVSNAMAAAGEPTEQAIRDFYVANQKQFQAGEQVHVRQILVHDEALAKKIVEQLRGGADFATMSAEHSLAANAKRGGDIGFVSRGELPRMFEDVVFALQPGQVSDVITTDQSFHVFQVDARRPPGQLDLLAATPVIRSRLREEALRQEIARTLAKARKEMQIAVLTKRLPFRYTGALPKSENE
jgi:peptidyl-prolyl cis-trans isomerase C